MSVTASHGCRKYRSNRKRRYIRTYDWFIIPLNWVQVAVLRLGWQQGNAWCDMPSGWCSKDESSSNRVYEVYNSFYSALSQEILLGYRVLQTRRTSNSAGRGYIICLYNEKEGRGNRIVRRYVIVYHILKRHHLAPLHSCLPHLSKLWEQVLFGQLDTRGDRDRACPTVPLRRHASASTPGQTDLGGLALEVVVEIEQGEGFEI